MLEAYSIKERLARDGVQANLKTIKKAMLLPEEPVRSNPSAFLYPSCGHGLLVNPYPAKKKKGKKGKKGRKK